MIVPGALWGVTAALAVTTTPPMQWQNLTGEGTTISWTVRRSRSSTSDTASVDVLNIPSVQQALLASVANQGISTARRMMLSIGWGQIGSPNFVPPQVLINMPIRRISLGVRSGPDLVTSFSGAEFDTASKLPASADLPSSLGVTWDSVVALLAAQMNIAVSPMASATIAAAAAARGVPAIASLSFVMAGQPSRLTLDSMFRTLGLSYSVDGGVLHAADVFGLRNDLPPLVLTPRTGLRSAATADDGSVVIDALAIPSVRPGQALTVINELGITLGGGVLRVDEMILSGDTSRGESNMGIVARRVVAA